MNVLVVSDVDLMTGRSGAERLLAGHCQGLAKRGHSVYLIAGTRDGRGNAVEEIGGVRVYRYRRSLRSCLGSFRLFRILARHVRFDVLIFHQPLSGLGVLLAPGSRHLPKACVFLSPWGEEYAARVPDGKSRSSYLNLHAGGRLLRRSVERFVLKACRRIFVLSRFMAGRLEAEHRGLNGRAAIVPGGVDLDQFRPVHDRLAVKEMLGLPLRSPVLLTIRNLEPRMGLDHLLQAMQSVVKTLDDVILIVGGEGPIEGALRDLAHRLGLERAVRFEGYVPEERLPLLYQAADFFVLPSKELEGFGLVAVEALACGTPVLGTPVGAIPEVLGGLEPDLVFGGTRPEAIAQGIRGHLRQFRADPQRYEALRKRCRIYASACFGWDRIIDRLEQELLDLIDRVEEKTRCGA
ncbi:MAG: glycosyltransferase family 4 protein [Candidatus Rokubacteria bacterium]|nr:glycosyltransferase family 4 protein [Candidatus Rokubacteria bacterium]